MKRDTMNSAFIDAAKTGKNAATMRTFVYALKTEAEHARLFADGLKNLDFRRDAGKQYFV